eukprot:jgi/Bigna1/69966/fgenesh1_pg.10_\
MTMEDVLEQFGDLDVCDSRRVAKCVLHCDGVDENVDDLVKVMTNDLESREFALHRCMDKGATLRTWAHVLKKSGDPDCAPPGVLETKERKAEQQPSVRDIAGAIDSFRRHCPIEGKLCVASKCTFWRFVAGLTDLWCDEDACKRSVCDDRRHCCCPIW